MGWKPKQWILIGMLLSLFSAASYAQVTTTQVADTIYHADGTPATGTVLISWPSFNTSAGEAIASGSTSATIGTGGALSINLTPNAGATPVGTYYTAVLHLDDGTVTREYWVVPVSQFPVKISTIESTVLPTSVAMQTVSKAYVDTAIAAAVTGHPLDSTPYVLKSGDTMTGPLLLPGDPVSSLQAADKNYVDTQTAGVQSGLGQKVALFPTGNQTVAQPAGTELAVNRLNGVDYPAQYQSGGGSNGIANVVAGSDCTNGCTVKVTPDYASTEVYNTAALSSGTHVQDLRGGAQVDSFLDPLGVASNGISSGEKIDHVSTLSTDLLAQKTGTSTPASIGLLVNQVALAGGSNLFPEGFENAPFFKMAYSAVALNGTYNTQGQHGLMPENIDCFGVGDCLLGSRFVYASGGWRDDADEGAHLYDTTVTEDTRVFEGTCVLGCSAGSTSVFIRQDQGGGTQGDGRFLIDTNPAKEITSASTGGQIINGNPGTAHAIVNFSGTNFPVSVFLSTGQVIPSQPNAMEPGTVTFPIATSGVPSGFATNTAAIGNSSGVACVVDQNVSGGTNYEMAPYLVVDATHLTMTFNKPHHNLATLAFGGLCGYGIEQTVDTTGNIRQVFPVVGSFSSTGLYYEALETPVLGTLNETGAFMNMSVPISSMTRTGGVVSVVAQLYLPYDLNGVAVKISGAADSSYNGTFTITTTGRNTFTFTQAGPDSSTTGGTVSKLTGDFVLYPMAEVLSVVSSATKQLDGSMTLAPNNVPWSPNDTVEQPHFFQEYISADIEHYAQYVPRPTIFNRAGIEYDGNNGLSTTGWSINNASDPHIYIGYGGTHTFPTAAYESLGIWNRDMNLTAGEEAAFNVQCNLHGCGNWNSGYSLFELQSNAGYDYINYAPQTSDLTLNLRGATYDFNSSGLTANTINVTTLNATNIHGTVSASSVPVFGASGTAHAQGAVPDPGATAGSTRYLREDGTWASPGGSSGTVAITGGTIDGTTVGGTTPAAVSATSLNGLPVSEYTNVARKPLATLMQALHNAANQVVNIVVLSDSFGICDYTNCNTGPTNGANRYTELLRTNLQARYGSHGTGMVPLIAVVNPTTLNKEQWAVNGSFDTVNTFGPYQGGNYPGNSVVHLSNGEVATFTSSVPYDTINTYCMTTSTSGSIAVAIDGVSVGTACGATTSSATAHVATSSSVALATHTTTFTSTGDSYIYAAEGTAGSTGVSVHNVATGSAAAEWWGLNPSTQLAFTDLIPGGTHGVMTMLQTNEPGVGYSVSSFTSAMDSIIAHEQALPGTPSVMLVVPPVDAITGTAPYTAAQVQIAQQQNVGFVNIQDRWGTTYDSNSGLWDMGTSAPGIHPNDKGARDMYSMVYAGLIDPVPFGTVSTGGSGGGCTSGCTFSGMTTLNSGSGEQVLNMTSANANGTVYTMGGSAAGVHNQGFQSDNFGHFLVGDFTSGGYAMETAMTSQTAGFMGIGSGESFGFMPSLVTTNAATPDAAFSRLGPDSIAVGNGTVGDTSGTLTMNGISAQLYQGPASAPASGSACSTVGWIFSQDGHISFCNGTSWTTKL